ncbi:ergothioneine biosynthesis glutamate--cysteine ligase EgtA [Jatrophihabitans sp.]|uniref:ergothioneine biosynthesis glutamate--cysteine ligase EgtA n=1 Tax=Jatrophihabitans sp. TaxID=1932789 RepID=UPI0030C6E100|nr:glutamate/cysteine ligase family protein [Jatrophihabitans sp.]
MSAQSIDSDPIAADGDQLDLDAAHDHAVAAALTPSDVGAVGLELEYHLVDLTDPARVAGWGELGRLVADVPPLPYGSAITSEPGSQLELSALPQADIGAAIAALQADERALATSLRASGFGLAPIGTDLARPLRRVTPVSRYAAMEQHFDALGCGVPGRQMMSSTASLQVNLNAGPASGWADRVAHIHRLGPVLVALSACSPLLAGESSGWRSMRQQVWDGLDPARSGPIAAGDPGQSWASYALAAPVMLVRQRDDGAEAVTRRLSFADWVSGAAGVARAPTRADLDYHLSTLFPPVRLRGYLEIRYLDAVPAQWWPALATIVTTLIDDDVAADRAAEVCAGLEDAWRVAARDGLHDAALHRAAVSCLDIAARRCLPALRPEVEAYAELVARGRTPGDELRETAGRRGPLYALREVADA